MNLTLTTGREGAVHTSVRLVVSSVRMRNVKSSMGYGAWFLFTLGTEVKSQRGGLYNRKRRVSYRGMEKKEVKHPHVTQNSLLTVASFRTWRG